MADLEAALAGEQRARTAAEERAAAVPARELTSLQSLFRQAVEENRSLATQLHVARARIAELEATAAPACVAAAAPRPSSAANAPPAAVRLPAQLSAVVHSAPCSWPASPGSAGQQAGGCASDSMNPAKRELAMQLGLAAGSAGTVAPLPGIRAAAQPAGLVLPDWQSHHPPLAHHHHTVLTLPASLVPHEPAVAVPEPAAPAAHAVAAARAAAGPAAGLHQVFAELRALQQRVQVAEQQLQQRSAQLTAVPLQQQRQAWAPVYHILPPQLCAGGSPGSRPCSRPCSRPGSATLRPGSRGGSPSARPGSPAARHAEHRENLQLIRSLKQRRGQLEAGRLAAISATLAGAALGQVTGATQSPPSPHAAGQSWRFDTRDPSPSAAPQHQPSATRRRQAAPACPGSAGTWGRQQRFGSSAAVSSGAKGSSPMGWHAAVQMQGERSAQGSRGRRASLAAMQDRAAPSGSESRGRSRSRSRQEEVDRLLMGGRPTTLAGVGGGRSPAKRRGEQGSSWVTPVVLA